MATACYRLGGTRPGLRARSSGRQPEHPPYRLGACDGLLGGTQSEPHHTVVAVHATGNVDQQQEVLFEPRGALLGAEAQALDRAGDVVTQDRQLQPRRVDREPLARHVTGGQAILEFVVGVLDGAGFLPVPLQQANSVPIQVGDHRVMVAIRAVAEQHALRLQQPQCDVAQPLTVLVLGFLGRDVDHLRPLPQGAVGLGIVGGPLLLGERGDGRGQLRTHHRTHREADAPARLLLALRRAEPVQQIVLITGAVATEVTLTHRLRQRVECHLTTGQRFLLGRHIAVAELVGDDQIGFRPQRDHRLVAPPALVVSVCAARL